VASLGDGVEGGTAPVTQSTGDTMMKVNNFMRLNVTKGRPTGETITWKAERVEVVTTTKKGRQFLTKKR